jgi:hypothetical protein
MREARARETPDGSVKARHQPWLLSGVAGLAAAGLSFCVLHELRKFRVGARERDDRARRFQVGTGDSRGFEARVGVLFRWSILCLEAIFSRSPSYDRIRRSVANALE